MEAKVYKNKANASRRMKQLAELFPKVTFSVEGEGEAFTLRALAPNDKVAETLADEPVNVHVPTAEEKAAAKEQAKADKIAAREQAKAEAAAEREKAKAKAAAKKASGRKPKANGASEGGPSGVELAAQRLAARVAKGEPAFREGTKRALIVSMLEKGVTAEQAASKLEFNERTAVGGLYSTARLMGRSIARDPKTNKYAFA